jgi:hypothetical protein
MKALNATLAAVVLMIGAFIYIQTHHRAAVTLLPGQRIAIQNRHAARYTIRAEYPITISGPGCSQLRTAGAELTCGPGLIAVIDQRPPLFVWARANRVTWTAAAVW